MYTAKDFKEYMDYNYGNGKTVTISITQPCEHGNGWYNLIPARFWGRRKVFVCTDCGDILEPINKKERV